MERVSARGVDASVVARAVVADAIARERPESAREEDEDVGAASTPSEQLLERLTRTSRETSAELDAVREALETIDGSVDALRVAIGRKRAEGLEKKLREQAKAIRAAERAAREERDAVERRKRSNEETNGTTKRGVIDLTSTSAVSRGMEVKNAPTKKTTVKKKAPKADDDFFDDLFDASKGAATETERERLIRIGVLTPFDRLEGFERAVKERESSSKAAAATAAWRESRNKTKTLTAEEMPRLEANARPFASRATRNATSESTKKQMAERRAELKAKMLENDGAVAGKRTRQSGRTMHDSDEEYANYEETAEEDRNVSEEVEFAGGLSIPGDTYERLLPHQKTCLKWLWELHCQRA